MKQELLKGLTNEQINKVRLCKNNDEVLLLAKNEGVELSEEQLDAINGGCNDLTNNSPLMCPKCHATNIKTTDVGEHDWGSSSRNHKCRNCGYIWTTY